VRGRQIPGLYRSMSGLGPSQ